MKNYTQNRELCYETYRKIFLTQKNGTSKYIAIKKIFSNEPNFENEINLLKKVHHSDIMECYESFQEGSEINIVMESVNVNNLRTFLKSCQ
jgi:serine/threonine protein kinase